MIASAPAGHTTPGGRRRRGHRDNARFEFTGPVDKIDFPFSELSLAIVETGFAEINGLVTKVENQFDLYVLHVLNGLRLIDRGDRFFDELSDIGSVLLDCVLHLCEFNSRSLRFVEASSRVFVETQ